MAEAQVTDGLETPRFYLPPILSTPVIAKRSAAREETIPVLPDINVKGDDMDNRTQTLQRPNQLCIDEYFPPQPLGKPDQRLQDESVTRFSLGAGITAMKAEQDLVEFIFAAMVDRVIYKWFQIHCEGCQEHYPSQRDHACLNCSSMDSLVGLNFREFHSMVSTVSVVGACQTYLKHTPYHIIASMTEDLQRKWTCSPQHATDVMEQSNLNKTVRNDIESELVSKWLGDIEFPDHIELTYNL